MTEPQARRILIVDDESGIRKLLKHIIARLSMDIETTEAGDGAEAIRLLETTTFDLVLLDINMPVMDGLETLRWIRENGETEQLPVFMLSGDNAPEDIYKGHDRGATQYLTKPFEKDNVAALLKAHYDGDLT